MAIQAYNPNNPAVDEKWLDKAQAEASNRKDEKRISRLRPCYECGDIPLFGVTLIAPVSTPFVFAAYKNALGKLVSEIKKCSRLRPIAQDLLNKKQQAVDELNQNQKEIKTLKGKVNQSQVQGAVNQKTADELYKKVMKCKEKVPLNQQTINELRNQENQLKNQTGQNQKTIGDLKDKVEKSRLKIQLRNSCVLPLQNTVEYLEERNNENPNIPFQNQPQIHQVAQSHIKNLKDRLDQQKEHIKNLLEEHKQLLELPKKILGQQK